MMPINLPLFVLILLAGCITSETPEIIEVSPVLPASTVTPTTAQMIAALDRDIPEASEKSLQIQDIRLVLKAKDLEERGNWAQAVPVWMDAMKVSQGSFGKAAFDGWLGAYVKTLKKKSDPTILAKLVLAETQDGQVSQFVRSRRLNNVTDMAHYLKTNMPDALVNEVAGENHATRKTGSVLNDQLFEEAARSHCLQNPNGKSLSRTAPAKIPAHLDTYWEGLVAECAGFDQKAIAAYELTLKNLLPDKNAANYALNTAYHLISFYKKLGRREKVADTYVTIVKIWDAGGLKPIFFRQTPREFTLTRINDTLWAARNSTLIGDLTRGRQFIESATEQINNATSKLKPLSEKEQTLLTDFKVDAYHILASRVAFEKQEFDTAISLTTVALMTPRITSEWKDRLGWHLGLYSYVAGEYLGARRHWENALAATQDESMRAQLFFWLGKTYEKLNLMEERDKMYESVAKDYPLNYYTVVALKMANHPSASQWQKIFKSPAAMATELSTRSDFDLDSWRENKKIARLLFRSEILVKANLGDWTKLGVMELSDAVSKEYALVSKNLSAFVYLTRLQFLAGLHHNSISLTTSMMKIDPDFWKTWPEQLLIYFPQPYSEVFGQYAQKLAMDEELLYAVSRQETSFRARVTSNAGAVGLMQLLPVTAAKFAREAGQRVDRIEQDLLEVDFNIAVGGTYLKYLDSYYRGFLPGVFGGYNAGEMAINYWVSRRHHADPLVWVELVPFGETKGYIKNVWRNYFVYKFLGQRSSKDATH